MATRPVATTTQKQPPPPVQKPQASSLRSRPPGFDNTETSSCIRGPRAGQGAPWGSPRGACGRAFASYARRNSSPNRKWKSVSDSRAISP